MARLEKMQNIKRTLARIESNKQQIKKQTKILEKLENKQKQQKQELVQNKKEHSKIFFLLKNNIAAQNEKLTKLIRSKKNLEKLIEHLVPIKEEVITTRLMAQLCQNFIWPTKGDVIIHFGSPIEQSSWSWSGIIIAAPQNQTVRAVSSGKVVYAGWFTGYGLLLIIDHGSGYMSLYGHNDRFSKKVDDKVEAGEIIAFVGKSDGEEPGLYFAIRYNGKPVNPEKWCK
jgi:murein hydrolase activator